MLGVQEQRTAPSEDTGLGVKTKHSCSAKSIKKTRISGARELGKFPEKLQIPFTKNN